MHIPARRLILGLAIAIALVGCNGAPSPQNAVSNLIGPCGAPVGYTDLAWSPDSGRIAFTLLAADGNEIAVMNADGGSPTRISDPAGSSYSPQWSPDGKQLVFVTQTKPNHATITAGGDATRTIDVANIDGSGQHAITPPGDYYFPSWSSDGEKIVFELQEAGKWDVFLMDADGTNVSPIGIPADSNVWPIWSPDGMRIAFVTIWGLRHELYVINRDGTDAMRVAGIPGNPPVWSPDSRKLLYSARYNNVHSIFIADANHSEASASSEAPIVSVPGLVSIPVWSGDGQYIIFDERSSSDVNIFRMNADGSGQVALTTDPASDVSPAASPDGKTIAFISFRNGEGAEIYTMGIDGSHQTRLTINPANQQCLRWPF